MIGRGVGKGENSESGCRSSGGRRVLWLLVAARLSGGFCLWNRGSGHQQGGQAFFI